MMTVKDLRDAMGQIDENYIAEAIEYHGEFAEISDDTEDADEESRSDNKKRSVVYIISTAAACAALVFAANHFINPEKIGIPEIDNSAVSETTTSTFKYTETALSSAEKDIVTAVSSSNNTNADVTSVSKSENAVAASSLPATVITESVSRSTEVVHSVTMPDTSVPVIKDTVPTTENSTVITETTNIITEVPPVYETTTVTSELIEQVEPKHQSIIFKNYTDLSASFIKRLDDAILEMKNEYVNINVIVNTESIEKFRNKVAEKNAIIIPVYDGKQLQLRNEEGFSDIIFDTRELYSKPCFFFRFEDGTTNSYIRIYDISDELRSLGSVNAYEFMKIKNPDSSFTYDQKTVHMEDRDIEVAFRKPDNDPRIYAYFIYDDSLVMLCCSQDKIDSGFLNAFSLADMPLT